MQKPTVIFAHGREAGPWGTKIRILAQCAENYGCPVISRDDQDTQDPNVRVERLINEAQAVSGPLVLVGSSMGGYVAAKASASLEVVGLFLMAPAFGLPDYEDTRIAAKAKVLSIVHGWDDRVVPTDAVITFAERHRARLHLVPAEHALIEDVDYLARVFENFLDQCLQTDQVAGRISRLMASF